jgi:hypothetical protein
MPAGLLRGAVPAAPGYALPPLLLAEDGRPLAGDDDRPLIAE